MKVRKTLTIIVTLLVLFASCENTDYLSSKYGEIISDEVIRIEYYERPNNNYSISNIKPNSTVTDTQKIAEIVTEINTSNNPELWKGVLWDKVVIVKNDTSLIYNTNGKVIGKYRSKGFFYELKDERFIERYFGN